MVATEEESAEIIDFEKLLLDLFGLDEDVLLIFISKLEDGDEIPLFGERSFEKFLSSLGYEDLLLRVIKEKIENNVSEEAFSSETFSTNLYYNYLDSSHMILDMYRIEIGAKLKINDKNILSTASYVAPFRVELPYENRLSDFTSEFLDLINFYPKKVVVNDLYGALNFEDGSEVYSPLFLSSLKAKKDKSRRNFLEKRIMSQNYLFFKNNFLNDYSFPFSDDLNPIFHFRNI